MFTSEYSARAVLFGVLVGQELRDAIGPRGGASVARAVGIERATFSRFLTGKKPMPLYLLVDACEVVRVNPRDVIDRAYARLLEEDGPPE